MPAAGKTTVGRQIAEALQYPFYDLDWEIEKRDGRSIPEIFEQEGEDAFREKEREVLREVQPSPAVIATGGGAPCFFDNMERLLQQGYCLYLEIPVNTLAQRAWQKAGSRPLLAQDSLKEMEKAIGGKLSWRRPFYERAHQTITLEALQSIDWKAFFAERSLFTP